MYNNNNNQQRPKKNFHRSLNLHEPIVVQLAEKHNLKPKLVAYIRAAIIGEFARYNKETLIQHIQIDNERRLKAIEEHKVSELLNEQQRADSIKYTQANIEFREGVVEFLNTVSDEVFNDLIQVKQPPRLHF